MKKFILVPLVIAGLVAASVQAWDGSGWDTGGAGGLPLAIKNGSTSAGYIDLYEDSDAGSNYVRLIPPALAASWTFTLPDSDGANGEILQTNGSGVTSWVAAGTATMAIGSAVTDSTSGSILFADGSSQLAQSNAILHFNGTNVGIGNAAPASGLHVNSALTTSPRGIMSSQHNVGTDGARIHLRKSRGSFSSPSTVVTGDMLGRLVFSGYDGTNYLEMGGVDVNAEGTVASTRVPTRLSFWTGTNAAPSVLTERMRISADGYIGINETAPDVRMLIDGDVRIKDSTTLGAALTDGWTNNATYPYETFTASGLDISSAINSNGAPGIAYDTFAILKGHRYRMTFTATINVGTTIQTYFATGATGASSQKSSAITSGANVVEFTSTRSGTEYVMFYVSSAAADFAIADFALKEVTGGDLDVVGQLTVGQYERHIQIPINGSAITGSGTCTYPATPVAAGVKLDDGVGGDSVFIQWEVPTDMVPGTNVIIEVDWIASAAVAEGDTVIFTPLYKFNTEGDDLDSGTASAGSGGTVTAGAGGIAQGVTTHTRITLAYADANQPVVVGDHLYMRILRADGTSASSACATAFEVIYQSNSLPMSN